MLSRGYRKAWPKDHRPMSPQLASPRPSSIPCALPKPKALPYGVELETEGLLKMIDLAESRSSGERDDVRDTPFE